MRFPQLRLIVAGCLLVASARPARGVEADPGLADEPTLQAAGLAADTPQLLDFFRKRSQGRADQEQIRRLVRQLGDRAPATRAKAAAELVCIGPAAIPWLRQAVKDPD